MLAVPALLLAACGSNLANGPASSAGTSAAATPSASMASGQAASTKMIMLKKAATSIGPVLVDAQGFTLYRYDKDTKNTSSACAGSCATAWPPLLGRPSGAAAMMFVGKFGTITRPGGMIQATYKGHPLYTYAGDHAPGQTNGNGSGGTWHVLKVSLPASMSASPMPSSSATMTGGGGGGGY